MPGTDIYDQGIPYLEYSDAPDLQVATKGIVDAMVPKLNMTFTDAAERNATIVSPIAGMVAFLTNEKIWTGWDGAVWVPLGGGSDSDKLTANTSKVTTTETNSGLSVALPTIAGKEYKLSFSALVRSTVADDRPEIRIRRGTLVSGTQVGGGLMRVSTANSGETLSFTCFDTPGAGSTTWTAWYLRTSGTGQVDITASATLPAVLTVETL